MARTEVAQTVQITNPGTGAVTGASGVTATIRNRNADGSAGTAATLYTSATGGTTYGSNVIVTDAAGRISRDAAEVWVEPGAYLITVAGTGITTPYSQAFNAPDNIDLSSNVVIRPSSGNAGRVELGVLSGASAIGLGTDTTITRAAANTVGIANLSSTTVSASGTVSGGTVTASGTVSGSTVSGTTGNFTNMVRPVVSSLPGSPADGQEVYYATNNRLWHLRFNAALGGAQKWQVIAAPPLEAQSGTLQDISTTSYVNYQSVALSLPLAGTYALEIFTTWQTNGSQNATGLGQITYNGSNILGTYTSQPLGFRRVMTHNSAPSYGGFPAAASLSLRAAIVDADTTMSLTLGIIRATPVLVG